MTMAAAKRVLGDSEAMLRKVELEITECDGLMETYCHASQPHQSEKCKENLKFSIKKLQRDRAQLSTWISDKSVKEKSALTDARSKIEARMMKFKTLEGEVLATAFNDESDEGHAELQPCVEEGFQACVHAGVDCSSPTIFTAAGVSMAAAKRVLGDSEARLRKVELEITEFDGLMETYCHASQPHQSEKCKENLKFSIKKLQRDRAHLSTWISDKSVKEKSALTDARSKIEARMMKFKTLEGEVLATAFNDESDEGHAELQPCVEEGVQACVHAGVDCSSPTIFTAAGVSMAAAKRVLGDSEAMLRKVELEITEFDGLMETYCHASQPHQSEKCKENLKFSIKKLQRDRAHLSTWISDKSVKEKSALTDARSKIEARMMKFKTLERDLLATAFNDESEEGHAVEVFRPQACTED